jgi:hypothetical protein
MKTTIRIISVNSSGKSAFAVVESVNGFVKSNLCAGNIHLPEGVEVTAGDVQDITGASVELTTSEYEGQDIPWIAVS